MLTGDILNLIMTTGNTTVRSLIMVDDVGIDCGPFGFAAHEIQPLPDVSLPEYPTLLMELEK